MPIIDPLGDNPDDHLYRQLEDRRRSVLEPTLAGRVAGYLIFILIVTLPASLLIWGIVVVWRAIL